MSADDNIQEAGIMKSNPSHYTWAVRYAIVDAIFVELRVVDLVLVYFDKFIHLMNIVNFIVLHVHKCIN